jgi:hypothetical protein
MNLDCHRVQRQLVVPALEVPASGLHTVGEEQEPSIALGGGKKVSLLLQSAFRKLVKG